MKCFEKSWDYCQRWLFGIRLKSSGLDWWTLGSGLWPKISWSTGSNNHLLPKPSENALYVIIGNLFINLQKLFATKPFTRNHISCSRNVLKLTYSKVENQKFPLDPRFRGGMGGEGNLSQGLSCQVVGNPRRYTQSYGFKLVRQKDELI